MGLATIGGVATWTSWLQWHNRLLEAEVARADRQTKEAEKQARIAGEQAALVQGHLHAESLRRAHQALEAHQIELAQDILHDDQRWPDGVDHRGFGWRYLWRQATRDIRQLWGHQGRVLGSAVSPDGRSLATVDLSGNILIWDPAEGASLDRPSAAFSSPYPLHNITQFSRDGRFLAVGLVQSNQPKQGIRVFDRAAGRCLVQVELHAGEDISSVAFDDRPKLFVTTLYGPTGISLRFHDLANPSATPRTRSLGTTAIPAFLSPDARFVGVQNQGGIELSDPETGQVLVHLADAPAQVLWPVGLSMDGRFVAGLCGNEILVWETERGQRIGRAAVAGRCDVFAWSPRGRCLGWGEENGRLATLEPASGRVREFHAGSSKQKLRGHGLSFSSDKRLLAVTTDGAPGGPSPPEVWELERGRRISKFPGRNDGGSASFLPGGHDVLVSTPLRPPDLAARASYRARRAGRPRLGGLGRRLLTREGSGDRQRRHWRATDHQVLGPGVGQAARRLEGAHGHGCGPGVQPRWANARLRQPGLGASGQSQLASLGRQVSRTTGNPARPFGLGSGSRLQP